MKEVWSRAVPAHIIFLAAVLFSSCTVSKIYPKQYYEQHKDLLHETEALYGQATKNKLIAVAFTDLGFSDISLELKTDSVRYIYDFTEGEARINDTLNKYGYDPLLVQKIIGNMRMMKSTWINTLDHYVDGKKQVLLVISAPVKQFTIFPLMQKRKYYLFNFYKQPQYYDDQGRLLDKRRVKLLRKINNDIFWRINDKVCYTISGKFR
jgi:hypothetical protein